MSQPSVHVPEAELSVLKLLWDRGSSTIRELTDVLYPRGDTAHYATVQKLLERLRSKGFVRRRKQGRGHAYSAVVERGELIGRRLQETAEQLCGGSLTPLLTHLVSRSGIGEEDLAALRALVDRLDTEAGKEGR
ncbi:MAG: BlaI/MecI/CopY family transcriptional regulator [Acidobacteriota bacterium]|jgi:predicted transcriptional regulator